MRQWCSECSMLPSRRHLTTIHSALGSVLIIRPFQQSDVKPIDVQNLLAIDTKQHKTPECPKLLSPQQHQPQETFNNHKVRASGLYFPSRINLQRFPRALTSKGVPPGVNLQRWLRSQTTTNTTYKNRQPTELLTTTIINPNFATTRTHSASIRQEFHQHSITFLQRCIEERIWYNNTHDQLTDQPIAFTRYYSIVSSRQQFSLFISPYCSLMIIDNQFITLYYSSTIMPLKTSSSKTKASSRTQ